MNTLPDPRYPIGQFEHDGVITTEQTSLWIDQIEELPSRMRAAVEQLDENQLDVRYRDGGWTLRQVAHHVPDSHLNAYVRFKWALTEDEPTIKPYDESLWAELADYRLVPVEVSLAFLESLHVKLVALLRALSSDDLTCRYIHPEAGMLDLARTIGIYAWHGRHHLAHITTTAQREGW
ncbi:MAG: putative metal-dependent hydrolase [Acidobacteria bacterium]|nr:putative metal-dependent hydrolase [Acidobacteriota bacterium]